MRNTEIWYARLDELPPSLLALFALHPLFVQDDELRVVVVLQLRELGHRVFEDLIVDPAQSSSRFAETPTDWEERTW